MNEASTGTGYRTQLRTLVLFCRQGMPRTIFSVQVLRRAIGLAWSCLCALVRLLEAVFCNKWGYKLASMPNCGRRSNPKANKVLYLWSWLNQLKAQIPCLNRANGFIVRVMRSACLPLNATITGRSASFSSALLAMCECQTPKVCAWLGLSDQADQFQCLLTVHLRSRGPHWALSCLIRLPVAWFYKCYGSALWLGLCR